MDTEALMAAYDIISRKQQIRHDPEFFKKLILVMAKDGLALDTNGNVDTFEEVANQVKAFRDSCPAHPTRRIDLPTTGNKCILNIDNSSNEETWITVNGTPVKVVNGKLTGEIGEKITKSKMDFSEEQKRELNEKVKSLQAQGFVEDIGQVASPVPIEIKSISQHAAERLRKHGITKEDAQAYIDNAMVMFKQTQKDERHLYVSKDGNAIVLVDGDKLITAYPSESFDEGMKKLINEVKAYVN